MKIVAVVPIKLNNERLPNKNIKAFDNGNPLCYYIFQTLLSISEIDAVYVYCSNPDIKKYIPEGVEFLQRCTSLDRNETKMNEVLSAFAQDVKADVYVMTHATSPFIGSESIKKGLEKVVSQEYDSAFAVKKIQTFLWENNCPLNYDLNNIPRTQDLAPIYEETSGFYIYTKNVIDRNRRIGDKPFLVEVNQIESIDIDEQQDFDIANAVFNRLINKKQCTV